MSTKTGGDVSGVELSSWVRVALRCPTTGVPLVDALGPSGEPELHAVTPDGGWAYPIRDGIPVLLAAEARPLPASSSSHHAV